MIIIKTEKEIEAMRKGGKLLAGIMEELGRNVIEGKNTWEIDQLAERLVFENGGRPVFKGYPGPEGPFPGTICISLNNEIVHGIGRKDRIIRSGDLVKIDIGMKFEGMITDMARTFAVGKITPVAKKLMDTTKESLEAGIAKIRAGAKISEYGATVDAFVRSRGFSTVRDLVGHGVGRRLHEDPQIPNYRWKEERDVVLKEGMTIALEPMVNEGSFYIRTLPDGWTYATQDGKLSAHFENSVLVKRGGCEILTRI